MQGIDREAEGGRPVHRHLHRDLLGRDGGARGANLIPAQDEITFEPTDIINYGSGG